VEVGRLLTERYELIRPLSEGAMSTVWVGFDRTNNLEVAIKTISLDAAGWRAEIRDRFMKEARLLARGKHEHLVGVRDVGETEDGFLFLVLDLLDGETLADRLARETKLEWQDAVTLALGIARGVAALHRVGIVHRDLKPANVVLHRTTSGVVPTIIDLGIGKASAGVNDPELCATLTATGQVLGTPQYMSYEQALGQTDIDARTDVWALGVILYEMLTGSRPFDAPNTNAVLATIRRHEMRPMREAAPHVPLAVTRCVERCLSTNRSERVADAEALSIQLEAAIKAPSVSFDEQPRPSSPRHRRGFVLAIVSVVAALPLMAFILLRTRNEPSPTAPEIAVDVKGSSAASAPVLRLASNATSAHSAAEPPPDHVPPTPTLPTRKTSNSARSRTPLSHVDDSGF
jgi:serine/threonine protein kinase